MKLPSEFKKVDPIYGKFLVGYVYKQNFEVAINLTKPYSRVVLDVGFGSGLLFYYLANYTQECYGININPRQTSRAANILGNFGIKAHLVTSDIRRAPYPDSFFDVIYALNTLEHVKEIDVALDEIERILKLGGYFVVAAPTENWIYRVGRAVMGYTKPQDHYHTASDIKVILLQYFDIAVEKAIYPVFPLFRVYLCKRG